MRRYSFQIGLNTPESWLLGLSLYDGESEEGSVHINMLEIGFLFFTISFCIQTNNT